MYPRDFTKIKNDLETKEDEERRREER
jgi:tRNA/tmRNA/rRNA uracil-C5-methylase (TrmA/RlmC/RlmD family)